MRAKRHGSNVHPPVQAGVFSGLLNCPIDDLNSFCSKTFLSIKRRLEGEALKSLCVCAGRNDAFVDPLPGAIEKFPLLCVRYWHVFCFRCRTTCVKIYIDLNVYPARFNRVNIWTNLLFFIGNIWCNSIALEIYQMDQNGFEVINMRD